MNLDDFAELTQMEINAEDDGVDTVLGLMAKRLGRVPIPGAEVVENGWSLVAERAGRRNRIGAVLLRASPLQMMANSTTKRISTTKSDRHASSQRHCRPLTAGARRGSTTVAP